MLTEIRKQAIKQKEKNGPTTNLVQLEDSSGEAMKVMHELLLYNNKFMEDDDKRFDNEKLSSN
jgi:hypothetical protein